MSLTLQESINNAVSSLFTLCQHLFTLTPEQAEWLLLFTIVRQHCFCLNLTCFVLFASFIKYV